MRLAVALLLGLLTVLPLCAAESVVLKPVGGVAALFNRDLPQVPGDKIAPVPILVQGKGKVALQATDIHGQPVDWKKEVDLSGGAQTVNFDAGMGYYRIAASIDGKEAGQTEIGIIPPFHPGIRKDSFFASNTSSLKTGDELRFLQAIGLKVQRCHFQPGTLPLDFSERDRSFKEAQAHDTWCLPIVGYAFDGRASELAKRLRVYGPPADLTEYVNAWEQIVKRYPEITAYEFWNEPWIFEWTFADTPAHYREFQTLWCKMALKVNPNLRIIAGNSCMFVEDNIEPYPECWQGLLQGTSHHPYNDAGEATARSGANQRTVDYGTMVTRRMGLKYYYETEGGVAHGENTNENAANIVQYYVRAMLSGAFQGNAQWGIGLAPGWTKPDITFAVMTHFLEDRPPVADIWPNNELLWGVVCANPKFATAEVKALPRAKDLAARWDVPVPADRAGDNTKVAVVWAMTGEALDKLDRDSTLTIADATGLKAYDYVGREIPPTGGKLVVRFGLDPIYITSDTLSVVELRQRVGLARIENITPLNMYALSLLQPATEKQDLLVRIENQTNAPFQGKLFLRIGGREGTTSGDFSIPAGKLAEVAVPWPGTPVSAENQYGVELTASVTTGEERPLRTVTRQQTVEVARITKRTITVDGKLDDWRGVIPVVLFDWRDAKEDPVKYLLNPTLSRPAAQAEQLKKAPRIYLAYDEQFVYIAAENVGIQNDAGKIAIEGLPYRKGWPDGLNHVTLTGNSVQAAFGFRDRVPGYGRQMDDSWAWKGYFCDTDYQYVAHTSTDGDKLIRLWGADTPRANGYQIDSRPFIGPVAGAKVKISAECYEMAIPRGELKLFDPAQGRCRVGFVIDEKMSWARAAGVFDYWQNPGSFCPTWHTQLPCQTFFSIEK